VVDVDAQPVRDVARGAVVADSDDPGVLIHHGADGVATFRCGPDIGPCPGWAVEAAGRGDTDRP
jgi:hypothetical protein